MFYSFTTTLCFINCNAIINPIMIYIYSHQGKLYLLLCLIVHYHMSYFISDPISDPQKSISIFSLWIRTDMGGKSRIWSARIWGQIWNMSCDYHFIKHLHASVDNVEIFFSLHFLKWTYLDRLILQCPQTNMYTFMSTCTNHKVLHSYSCLHHNP